MKKIANSSSQHNSEFSSDDLRVWKTYNIGAGKLISWESIRLCPQEATSLMEETPFFPTSTREMNRTTNQQKKDDEDEDSIECPNPHGGIPQAHRAGSLFQCYRTSQPSRASEKRTL